MADRLRECTLFVFDLDGTLYLGDRVLPGAHELIETLPSLGCQYIYLTNNSSRAAADYVPRLSGLGFPCRIEDVFSSSLATAAYLNKNYPGAAVYPVGTAAFIGELQAAGVLLSQETADVVCVGFDTELTYEKLSRAVHFLRRGASFIAANPDTVCPMPDDEVLPDCGSICALLTCAAGSSPTYIGKPNPEMIAAISRSRNIPVSKIAVVGDRLYTDIAVGINAGSVSVCVLSGETDREMLSASPLKPDYVFPSALELLAHLRG